MDEVVLRVAAKAIIINEKNEVLIVREANTYVEGANIGKWGVPGGRIENSETFHDGLRREVSEEVGLEIEPVEMVGIKEWWPEIRGQKNHIVAIFVQCRPVTTDVRLSEEHDAYEWVVADSLNDYPLMQEELSVLRKFFSK